LIYKKTAPNTCRGGFENSNETRGTTLIGTSPRQ
jgi:hypothetical protein